MNGDERGQAPGGDRKRPGRRVHGRPAHPGGGRRRRAGLGRNDGVSIGFWASVVCGRPGEVKAVSQQPEAMTGDEQDRLHRVIGLAVEARASAYARYSRFAMGAAVVGIDGRTTRGVLVENVSLGLSMCAERVALFNAVTEAVTPAVLAVCAPRTAGQLTFPCGACLQVGLEVAGAELIVVAVDPDGVHELAPLVTLLTRAPKRHTPNARPGAG